MTKQKENISLRIAKTALIIAIITGLGTIIFGGGVVIMKYYNNEANNRTVKPVDQEAEDYYDVLEKKCGNIYDSCCLSSLDIMRQGKYKEADENGNCPAGFRMNIQKCITSYQWCEPIAENCKKHGEIPDYAPEDDMSVQCCNELKHKIQKKYFDENCVNLFEKHGYGGYAGICINCGDNICDAEFENQCNCPEDCGGEKNDFDEQKFYCEEDNDCLATCTNPGCYNKNWYETAMRGDCEAAIIHSCECVDNKCQRLENQLDTSDWQTYRNEEIGFEVKYPEEWLILTPTPEYGGICITPPYPYGYLYDSCYTNGCVNIVILHNPRNFRMEEFYKFYAQEENFNIRDIEAKEVVYNLYGHDETKIEQIKINNISAVKFSNYPAMGEMITISISHKNIIVELCLKGFVSNKETTREKERILMEIVNTFKFIEN